LYFHHDKVKNGLDERNLNWFYAEFYMGGLIVWWVLKAIYSVASYHPGIW